MEIGRCGRISCAGFEAEGKAEAHILIPFLSTLTLPDMLK
jgi:hypothetical protein